MLNEIREKIDTAVPEFSQLEAAKTAFFHDADAVNLFNEINDLRQTIGILQAQQMAVEPEQEAKLDGLMEMMRSNEKIMGYLRAKNAATSAARKIANYLSEGLGVPFSSGGCCG